MSLPQQLAKHLRDVHFGGNWTTVNLKDTLADVTWQQALTKVADFNTIATLVYHVHYYVEAVIQVLKGGPLTASDKYAFTHPPVNNADDWNAMLEKVWADAETFASLIGQLPEDKLWADFTDGKYGSYYRNIQGIIEHTHYHLGQIVLIKKMMDQRQAEVK